MLKSETNSNIMPTTAALPQMISFCSTLFITLSKLSLRKTDVICHDGGFYYPKFHKQSYFVLTMQFWNGNGTQRK